MDTCQPCSIPSGKEWLRQRLSIGMPSEVQERLTRHHPGSSYSMVLLDHLLPDGILEYSHFLAVHSMVFGRQVAVPQVPQIQVLLAKNSLQLSIFQSVQFFLGHWVFQLRLNHLAQVLKQHFARSAALMLINSYWVMV